MNVLILRYTGWVGLFSSSDSFHETKFSTTTTPHVEAHSGHHTANAYKLNLSIRSIF